VSAPPNGRLEIYKLAVEMADRVSARRAVASSFFLTVISTLLTLVGALENDDWALALPGLILALAWWALLTSYRRLNRAKYEVIQKLELELPAAPYTDEWDILKSGRGPVKVTERYFELGLIEQVVPLVFAAVFVAVLIGEVA
jgi:hypothetical protein